MWRICEIFGKSHIFYKLYGISQREFNSFFCKISFRLKNFLSDLSFKFKKFFWKEDKVEAFFRDLEDIGKGKKEFEIVNKGSGDDKFFSENTWNIVINQDALKIRNNLESLAKEWNIDLSWISLWDNEFLNSLKILAKINSSIDKKFKNITWNFVMTPFMKKVYNEKNKYIQKYRKYINSWKIDWKYFWYIHDWKPSIIFKIDKEKIMFHLLKDSYIVPEIIKNKL